MPEFFKYDPALTIEQMAEEAIRNNPELSDKGKPELALSIARYLSSSVDRNYSAERFNYLKALVDDGFLCLEKRGENPSAEEVAQLIGKVGLSPNLCAFLHEENYRREGAIKNKRGNRKRAPETKGNVKSSDEEALGEIIKLYLPKENKSFDCDLTYGEGRFYVHLPQPKEKYDINPLGEGVMSLEIIDKMKESKKFGSVVIDLPDIVVTPTDRRKKREKHNMDVFDSLKELYSSYDDMIWTAQFHLAEGGILVFKAQDLLIRDTECYNANMWTVDYAVDLASHNGLALIDEIMVVETDSTSPNGLSLPDMTRNGKRVHLFLVFKKEPI